MSRRTAQMGTEEALRTHPLLANISEDALQRVVASGEVRIFQPGEILLREGDEAKFFWLLCSGSAKIFYSSPDGFEVVVKLFRAPAAFGEIELLTTHTHVENCTAVDRATVFRLPAPAFEALLDESPEFTRSLLNDTCARFLIAAQNERALAFLTVPQRLAHLLLAYVRLYGVRVDGGMAIRIKLSQNDLANGLGVARRSVVRAINSWQRDGILAKRGTSYVIRDLDRLAAFGAHGIVGVDWIAGSTKPKG